MVTLLIRVGDAVSQRTPTQPDWVEVPSLTRACNEWRASGNALFVSGAEGTGDVRPIKLFTISSQADTPYRVCLALDETRHAHAVSPDGSLAAVVTSTHAQWTRCWLLT